ncbi:MAG: nitronate monooxygenase [Actinomycetota bacterium]
MFTTPFTTEYGLDWPVVSSGMAFVARAPLAAAVSGAGGLGVLGATAMPVELLEAEVGAIRSATDRSFGVNFIPRFGAADQVAFCAEARVPVVSFYWDPPEDGWVDQLHAAGCKVWIQVGSPEEAAAAVQQGADLVIVQGIEGGGHNRSVAGTFTIVPAVVDAIGPTPVLAAGGVADGRGVAAALTLGAAGVWVGTRYLTSHEADANAGYQARVLASGVADTTRHETFGFDFPGAGVRGIRNRIVAEHEGQVAPYDGLDPESQPLVGTANLFGQEVPLVRYMGFPPTAAAEGDLDEMSLLAGETAGLISELEPAAEITERLGREAAEILARAAGSAG